MITDVTNSALMIIMMMNISEFVKVISKCMCCEEKKLFMEKFSGNFLDKNIFSCT